LGWRADHSGGDLLVGLLACYSVPREFLKLARDDIIDVKAPEVLAAPASNFSPALDVKASGNVYLVEIARLGQSMSIPNNPRVYSHRQEVTPQSVREDERPEPP
jgi:hypothetical protein